jgi:ATP-dependent helicase/nuclease subunit A
MPDLRLSPVVPLLGFAGDEGITMALTQNTVVWASAGTGKTRKLVETYLELLDSGADPSRIVAVTFTEKAAAEMRERIRSAIYQKLSQTGETERGRWMRILSLLPAAPISTIHGFCGLILREHGIAAGIDPDFAVLNEQQSLDLAREAVQETLRSEIRSGDEGIAKLFGDFGLDKLVETSVAAVYWLSSLGNDPDWLADRIDDQQVAADSLEGQVQEYLDKYGRDFEAIGDLADELDARKARNPLRKRDDADGPLPRLGQIAGVETARQLTRVVSRTVERFQKRKRELNALDFDDLLLQARNLLTAHDGVRRHYHGYFHALLVDEFQDTDEVQARIIELLAEDPTGERRFAPGKLMVVGDPKQSIYRFRRARVTVFLRMSKTIVEDGGRLEHLRENRRSAAPIAEFANQLCESMMASAESECSYRIRFTPQDRLVARSNAPFLGITYVAAQEEVRAMEGRAMEAKALARLLKKWKSSGTIRSWKEVGMLFRATANMRLYIDALEELEIPVYVVQGTYFYRKTEVSDLIALLELIIHPTDPLLRAIVLSSSLAGLTFKDLLNGSTCEAFDALLQPWLDMRDRATAAEILQDVIRKTNFDVVMTAQRDGAQRVANIGKLIEITRDLARQGTAGLDDVVRHLRERAQDNSVREAEAQIVGEHDDVVRMLTVHQAKGLEFDIVIIPDLAAKTPRGNAERAFFSDRWGILAGASYGLHRKPLPHALILAAKDEDSDQQFEEEKRLLYVAITRAKSLLVLGEGFAKHGGPWLQWVQHLLDRLQPDAVVRARQGKSSKVRVKDFAIELVPAAMLNVPEQLDLRISGAAMVGADSVIAGFRSLDKEIADAPLRLPLEIDLTPSELSGFNRDVSLASIGTAGLEAELRLGTAAHRILELGLPVSTLELERQNLRELAAVLDSADWKALQELGPEREMPFMMHMKLTERDCWIRGRMDAVLPGSPPRVIDYKYAAWREGADESYDIQLSCYALALMKALDVEHVVGELWFLRSPMKIVRRDFRRCDVEPRLTQLLDSAVVRGLSHSA